jgi:tetratricopeptide (TPR) repeat protein
MRTILCFGLLLTPVFAATPFWAPRVPPQAHYSVEVTYSPDSQRLEGNERIRFRNDTGRPIGRIVLQWFGDVLRVRDGSVALSRAPGSQSTNLFDLPRDLEPGSEVELVIEFGAAWKLNAQGNAITSYLSPRLWWGFGTLDEYEVRVKAPEGYAVGTSGRYDPAAGMYRAERARAFGLFVGKGHDTVEADAGGVQVRAVFTPQGRPCAELLLKTAVDAIGFYRERFGMYPHRSLTIVPGQDYPAGGYPPATALVVVHGQHRMTERPEAFWRWITAHEVGHMYWGNYVLAQGADSLSWLMIGMGIHTDREYRRARGIKGAGNLEANYVSGVIAGRDTTMDITDEQERAIRWDFDNTVTHGKSAALLDALESVTGAQTFDGLYRRCLREYAGKQLGWREFQRLAEIESGQDLGWFFEAWARSSDSAAYRVAGRECAPADGGVECMVRVERTGLMRMPVTVAARFEDGSEQRATTERLANVDELRFRARSALKDVAIEPDRAVALADAPSAQAKILISKIRDLPWAGASEDPLRLWQQARELKLEDEGPRFKLAMLLYDSRHYAESLDAMTQLERTDSRFAALVWEGHLLDLLGRREEAVGRYQEALKVPGSPSMQHGQYGMTINRMWVEERLKTPFTRK